jgi:hypothetical protein
MPLKHDREGQKQLTRLLAQCYALLRKFGEKADLAELRDEGFQNLLSEYGIDDIERAFWKYMETADEMPRPKNILAILDPKTQPLCKEVYIRLSQKRAAGDNLDSIEWAYMHAYENMEFKKL